MATHKPPRPQVTPLEERIDPATMKVVSPVEDQRQLQQATFRGSLGAQNERETVTLAQPQNGRTLQVTSTANKEGFVVGKDGLNPNAKKQEPGSLDGQPIGINPQVIDARPGTNKSLTANASNSQTSSSVDQGPIKIRNPGTMSLSEAAKSNTGLQAGSTLSTAKLSSEMAFAPPANNVAWAIASQNEKASFIINDDIGPAPATMDPDNSKPKPETPDIRELDDLNRKVYSTDPRPHESLTIMGEPQKSEEESDRVYVVGPQALDQAEAVNGLALKNDAQGKKERGQDDEPVKTPTSVSPTPNDMRDAPVAMFVLTSSATQRNNAALEEPKLSAEKIELPNRHEPDRSLPESHVTPGTKTHETDLPRPAAMAENGIPTANNALMTDATAANAGQSDLLTNQETQRRASPPQVD